MQTNIRLNHEDGCILPASEQFLDLLFGQFTAAYRTFIESLHYLLLLFRQLIQRAGSGR